MFSRYFKFHLYSMIAVLGTLFVTVLLNIYAKSTGWMAVNIAIKAFAAVTLFESMLFYYKIMKTLEKVVENITKTQIAVGIISKIMVAVGLSLLGLNTLLCGVLSIVGVGLLLIFKVNQVNRILPHLCMELDAEIEKINNEDFGKFGENEENE